MESEKDITSIKDKKAVAEELTKAGSDQSAAEAITGRNTDKSPIAGASDADTKKCDSNDDTDDVDYSVWDYTPDQSVDKDDPDYYGMQQSQPCYSIRGGSYTPPGWKRKYTHRKRENEEDLKLAPKKLKFDFNK